MAKNPLSNRSRNDVPSGRAAAQLRLQHAASLGRAAASLGRAAASLGRAAASLGFVSCVVLPVAVAQNACGAPDAPIKTQAAEVSSAARRPDGIVIDLPHALPAAADRADARGVVALREPLSKDAIVAVVRAYTEGFLKEDIDALRALLASDASYIAPSGTTSPTGNIVDQWQTRLRNYDYSHLVGAEIFRADKIELKTYEESRDARPPNMRPDDVFVIVPIQTSHVGTDALFPERVSMILRREKGRYLIAGLDENFTP